MILLVGASASGKTEVAKYLGTQYAIKKVVTHTTRPPRVGERNGVDYFFVTVEEFATLAEQNFFVETTFYNGNYYGTSRPEIADDKVLVVDPNGLIAFNALQDQRIITFFLDATAATRYARMLSRGDPEANAQKRIDHDNIEFADEKIDPVHYHINSETQSVSQVGDEVYRIYMHIMKK